MLNYLSDGDVFKAFVVLGFGQFRPPEDEAHGLLRILHSLDNDVDPFQLFNGFDDLFVPHPYPHNPSPIFENH